MHSMTYHLANGDATMVELQSSVEEDSKFPETSYNGISTTKQLAFHVVYCSSQDDNYPSTELNNGILRRGWQSSRFCYYPQEIVLELQWPSRIINMQLLSHEFKISTKVEVFVSIIVPYAHEAICQMKRLGYLMLDCNNQSGHQARELKSVSIDSPATIIRLVFHKCHLNNYNMYNQVGLMALILTGEPLDEHQWTLLTQPRFEDLLQTPRRHSQVSKPLVTTMQGNSPEKKCDVDLSIASRIIQLQEEKSCAVLGEDYDEAKRLKDLIERLRALGEEIKQLEDKKQLAVENEDYDTAKSCKKEIEKLQLQEHLPEYNEQAGKVDEVSDCGVSSEESVEVAHTAEGSSSNEPTIEDLVENCGDYDKKEFGTQTLPSLKNTMEMKVDKQSLCKTLDLRPPKHCCGASSKRNEKKSRLLSAVFPWWCPKNAPKSLPPTNGMHDDTFIPTMIAPNLISNMDGDDTYVHVLPTVSYKNGSSKLLPIITRPMCHANGLHSLLKNNESECRKMAVALNNYPNQQSLIIEHPQTFLKLFPTLCNQNQQVPKSPMWNTMHQSNKPSLSTSIAKNVSLLSPMKQASFQESITNENLEHTYLNHHNVQDVYLSMESKPSIQNEIDQNIDKERSNVYQNLNSRFGALVKEYNEARSNVEQLSRVQNNDQQALNNQFGALVREYNEARNFASIQNEEKKMRNQNMSIEQDLRDKVYIEQSLQITNNECNNESIAKKKHVDYYDCSTSSFENNEQLSSLYNDDNEQEQTIKSSKQLMQIHNNSCEEMKNFQNKDMEQKQNNWYDQMDYQNNEQTSQKSHYNHGKVINLQNDKESPTKTNDGFEVNNFQHDIQISNMHRKGHDQTKSYQTIDDEKIKGLDSFMDFRPLNGLSNLCNLNPKELKLQRENELFAKMEKNFQRNKRLETNKNKQDTKNQKNHEQTSKLEQKQEEEKSYIIPKKIDIMNNDEEVIKVKNTNNKNKRDNSSPINSDCGLNGYNELATTHSSISNNTEYNLDTTSNSMALSKKQKWPAQKNSNEHELTTKIQTHKNESRKQRLLDRPSSPKKSHVSIRERIAQAAKQAINDLVPEPLTESQMSEAGLLLKLVDVYYVQCLYSKEWKLRDKALQYFLQEINNKHIFGDALDVFRTINKVILKGLNDKVSNIFNIALQLSRVFIIRYASGIPTTDLRNYVNDLINILLEKLGDSNSRTKEAATEALMFLAAKKEIGLPIIANPLLRPPKNHTIWRPILGRLQLILVAIPTFGLHPPNKMGLQTEPLMLFIDQAFNNANGDVRNIAVKVTTEVYRLMGSPIEKYLKNVKPLVREVLTKTFEKISQEFQTHQRNTSKEESCFGFCTTPPQCTSNFIKTNIDEQNVGPSKECFNVIGKITSNMSNNNEKKIEKNMLGEDLALSICQEGCIGSKDRIRIHEQNSIVILPNKVSRKHIKKLQPIVFSNQYGLIPITNGHETQKIATTWDSNSTIPSTSNSSRKIR